MASSASRVGQLKSQGVYGDSPKGISSKKKVAGGESKSDLRKKQRRLTVMGAGDAAGLADDLAGLSVGEEGMKAGAGVNVVASYAGVSKKGYQPYNPRKKNQDALVMEEDAATGSLMLCVYDGHGQVGELVSQYFRDRFSKMVFKHAEFPHNAELAMEATCAVLEKKLLKDTSIDTEFSGTTAVMSVITGNVLKVSNIGDSRIILGTDVNGTLKPTEISDDQKPERPDEKKRILERGGRVFAVQVGLWIRCMDASVTISQLN